MARDSGLLLSDEELRLLEELVAEGVPFIIVGVGAALMQGADVATQDVDVWFKSTSHPGIARAAKAAGATFAWRGDPPMFLGEGFDDVDVVTFCHGLRSFDEEYAEALDVPLGDLVVKVLPLERIIASKTAAGRVKDRAAIPALEATLIAERATRSRGR